MVARIDIDQAVTLVREGAVLVDALPAAIYSQEHLPGAVNVPLETFRPDDVSGFDRNTAVVVYCFDQHCDLSSRAANRFELEGFAEVYDLIGGRAAWTTLGLPTDGTVGDRRRISHYVEPVVTVDAGAAIGDVADWPGSVAVVNTAGVLLGSLEAGAQGLPEDTPVTRAMVPAPGTIRPELRIDEVAARLRQDSLEQIFVTAVNGVLLGLVHRDRLHV